ncbi:uncharacterized protein [Amphiura filiformis]|uniref:uncharacterized protein n=1 Tax=Amphiura filiformis TaxID=82378 RepID=UPI003B2204A8
MGEHRKSLDKKTKSLYREYSDQSIKDFKGVKIDQLSNIEDLYEVNIAVYELVEMESEDDVDIAARLVRRSLETYPDTMRLNLYAGTDQLHFSFISNFERYTKSYACRKCNKLWKTAKQLHRHETICESKGTVDAFPRGIYVSPPSVFDEIREEGIDIPEDWNYYPHCAAFDFECYMVKTSEKSGGDHLTWTYDHIPLSVSICSNVPNYTTPVCFVSDGDPNVIVADMVNYLVEISNRSYELLLETFDGVISALSDKIEALKGEEEAKAREKYLVNLRTKLTVHLRRLPTFGFNSGRYDVNLVKQYLLPYLVENEPVEHLVKKTNNYMSINTDHLSFLDVTNFLAPGCSLDQFLRAFECSLQKGVFPYEWMHLDKLDHPSLPPKEAFNSALKGTRLTDDEYAHCQEVWDREDMKTMRDFLIWYNNLDVKPLVEALDKMAATYRERGIDFFKDGISVPGLTMKYLFKISPEANFALFGKLDSDLCHKFRDNIVGGPSIVFTRYHERGVTKLRGEKECEKIMGYDANALYLWAIKQDMPTGYPTRRKAPDFPKERKPFSIIAQEWLDWESHQRGIRIRHEGNNTEKRVGPKMLPVDGFSGDTVFEMQGCWYHGHNCRMNPRHEEKEMRERYQKTLEKQKYIEDLGYSYVEMWECDFNAMKRTNKELQSFLRNRARPFDIKITLTEAEIIDAIKTGQFFGVVECDIHVPEHLKSHFEEMPPIFKNTDISREDIGPFMKAYAEENDIMSTPRRSLIGSMFGSKILLTSPLAKWYLEHGVVITRVYEIAEYTPSSCFSQFVDNVSDARRAGDSDPSKSIIADTMKLMGNSSYGKTITNKYKHRNVKIANHGKASKLVNEILFRDLNQITDDCYEVELAKTKIKHDLPLQIGFFVYQYAKLRVLQFYYDCLDVYVDRSDFELVQMDTDSAYLAIAGDSLESLVKPELKDAFERERSKWFPRTDTEEHRRYDKRTPGLFKLEWEGEGIVALCSKTWYGFGPSDKFSCKGANKRNNQIDKEKYLRVLKERKPDSATNRGFRVKDNRVHTYEQVRSAFSYFYPKRKVLEDGITTTYLDI